MPKQRRRPLHYLASSLFDGTVLAAWPIRKPIRKVIKRDSLSIDADGVCQEYLRGGGALGNANVENRFRFQDIMAANLNTRRALRQIVLPALASLHEEVAALRSQLDRIEGLIEKRSTP